MLLDKISNWLLFKYYKVSVGNNFRCEGRLILQGHGKYVIGDDVHMISKMQVNPVAGDRTVLQTLDGGKIIIGNRCGLSHAVLCAREKIELEDFVQIGGGTAIYDNDFHSIDFEHRMQSPDTHIQKKAVLIKKELLLVPDP